HNLSQSSTVTEVVQPGSTTTSVTSSLNPSVQGQSVTFTAMVIPSGATGSVTFRNRGNSLGSSMLSNGTATLNVSTLPAGSNSISAFYNGDSRYTGSTSPTLTQTVRASTTTSLSTSPNPSVAGAVVTLAATVSPATAIGTVQFLDGAAQLGSANLSNGQAQLSVANLASGTHSLTAVYVGDSNDGGSTSPAVAQVVKLTSTTTLTSNPKPSTFAASVLFTAMVTPNNAT